MSHTNPADTQSIHSHAGLRTIRTLLVDDEPLALKGLALRLEDAEEIEIVGQCRNGREAVRAIETERPDLVFLDIQMPGLNGFDVIESLSGKDAPLIVFVTAYDAYALDAFRARAIDYLLKPVDQDQLAATLDEVRARLREMTAEQRAQRLGNALAALGHDAQNLETIGAVAAPETNKRFSDKINIKDRGRIICVDVDTIEWIDAAGDYMCVHALGETHVMRETMKSLEKRLDPTHFKRVHRSAIVNLRKVKSLEPHSNGECFLTLEGGGQIKVSRSYRAVINRFI